MSGDTILAVGGFHEVLLWKADGSELVGRLVGLSERIESLAFSPDGKKLAVTGGLPARMGEVQVWDVAKRKLVLSVPVTYDTVYGASWSPDGTKIAFGCADNGVRAIDAKTGQARGKEIQIAVRPGSQARPAISSDGKTFFVVWQEARGDLHGIQGTRVSTAGQVLGESQTLAELSQLPVTIRWPFGEKATDATPPPCPLRVSSSVPLAESQTLAVWSRDPVTSFLPSGLNRAVTSDS